jgi:DNA-binding response OmpR family regulator
MERRNLLIVDDDSDVTSVLRIGLERRGMAVTALNDPMEAIEAVKKQHYDLIITDIGMPKMSGFDLYREIRKNNESLPICFLSSFEISDTEFDQIFPATKAHIFMKKPISFADLTAKIDELTLNGSMTTDK